MARALSDDLRRRVVTAVARRPNAGPGLSARMEIALSTGAREAAARSANGPGWTTSAGRGPPKSPGWTTVTRSPGRRVPRGHNFATRPGRRWAEDSFWRFSAFF